MADLFTLLEVILAGALFVMTIIGVPPDYAILVFVAGELCDAVDGPCARRWHYPSDGKYRWWRHYNVEIDQISDILLAVACGVYLIFRVSWQIGCGLLFGIGIPCLIVQLYLYRFDRISTRFLPRQIPEFRRKKIVLIRRMCYVFIGVGGAIITLLWHAGWSLPIKVELTVAGAITAIIMIPLKINRLVQDKTPL